jgi:DNA replication protein DnaC
MEYKDKIFNKMDKILERKKQIILYGVPGVGKTYLAKKFVNDYSKASIKTQYLNNSQSDNDLSNLNVDAGGKSTYFKRYLLFNIQWC